MTASSPSAVLLRIGVAVFVLLVVTVAVSLAPWFAGVPVAGVWKATDEYGGQHFFEFHKDGTFTMWDRDIQEDKSYRTRGPFKGTWSRSAQNDIEATTGWNGYRAKLTFDGGNEMKHEHTFGMRSGLTFRRLEDGTVAPTPDSP